LGVGFFVGLTGPPMGFLLTRIYHGLCQLCDFLRATLVRDTRNNEVMCIEG
jgi:hypothetical protein